MASRHSLFLLEFVQLILKLMQLLTFRICRIGIRRRYSIFGSQNRLLLIAFLKAVCHHDRLLNK